jgi:hypothetical protein
MAKTSLLADLLACDSLDELIAFLHTQPRRSVVKALHTLFDSHAEYNDANEWAAAVRICESLAIVGWAPRERVDAISHFNGDHWHTAFVNGDEEERFRAANWTKRKAGWSLFNPEFNESPDWPGRPSVDWMQYDPGDHPVCDRSNLPSQRNYQQQMPIVMGLIGGENKVTRVVEQLAAELDLCLRQTMQPALYGQALERFYFRLVCPYSAEPSQARLKIGALNLKERAFYCDLYVDRSFGRLAPREQRERLTTNLLTAVDAFKVKIDGRGIDYDIERFRADVVAAIDKFRAKKRKKKPHPGGRQ